MRKRAMIPLAAAIAGVALTGGVALAATVQCTGNPCEGTTDDDSITGTANPDRIFAKAGKDNASGFGAGDRIEGARGADILFGDDGLDRSVDGDDKLFGGRGPDQMLAAGRSDLFVGGDGNDAIDARENNFIGDPAIAGTDTVRGGAGNDQVFAMDGAVDHINCGKGREDSVVNRDPGLDTVEKC
jgi:hypothetical protein